MNTIKEEYKVRNKLILLREGSVRVDFKAFSLKGE